MGNSLFDQLKKTSLDDKTKAQKVKCKAIAAQIIQLIETNRIKDHDGEIIYNFTDANVVK